MRKPDVHCIVMGGGRGTRLYPLTQTRCKPAVPLAGKYQIVDVPISNCLNAGYNRIYLLTQFNSASLHHHIQQTYHFDCFGKGFVEILSAEQTENNSDWYQGTADAVRQNLKNISIADDSLVMILSGDQLYRMDLQKFVAQHLETKAEISIACKPFPKDFVSSFGVMRIDENLKITEFFEKPQDFDTINKFLIGDHSKIQGKNDHCLVSMGIYIFNGSVLKQCLAGNEQDFGKHIIPQSLEKYNLFAHIFDGYWEDIGTVGTFFEANLMLTDLLPPFDFFDEENPIYSSARYLPASKLNSCRVQRSVIAEGCILSNADIHRCVIGCRSIVREHTQLENVLMLGADCYERLPELDQNQKTNFPNIGIGQNCYIRNAIIDSNVRIGNNVRLSPEGKSNNFQQGPIYVRDGILCISKGGIIPDNTIL